MVNENNIPKTEEIREIKNEIPSYEEFMKTYQADETVENSYWLENQSQERGYGPCKNSLCGCHCPKTKCDCRNPEFSIYKKNIYKVGNSTASGGVGLGGNSASGDVNFTFFRESHEGDSDFKVGTFSAGVDVVNGGLGGKVTAGANLIDCKKDGVEAKLGINLDTGAKISSDGVELKAAGFGFTVGKKLEVSTIVGGVSVDTSEDCVIQ